jgi:hypothetical protein
MTPTQQTALAIIAIILLFAYAISVDKQPHVDENGDLRNLK